MKPVSYTHLDVYKRQGQKQVYYFSIEFLLGRMLGLNLLNTGLREVAQGALQELGIDLAELEKCEADAGLGNGGLGRLGACFLDSMASLGIAGQDVYKRQVGDFNGWQEEKHPLTKINAGGVWSGFVTGAEAGQYYKYQLITAEGKSFLKADPYGFYAELRPGTASRIYDLSGYQWQDQDWMQNLSLIHI